MRFFDTYQWSSRVLMALLVAMLLFGAMALFTVAEDRVGQVFFRDTDGDGLSDEEEAQLGTDAFVADTDGDSYSDGVEVRSGYDPLLAAPADRTVDVAGGVGGNTLEAEGPYTEKLSSGLGDLLGSAQAEGRDHLTIEELNDVVESALSDVATFDELPWIDDADIRVKETHYEGLSEEELTAALTADIEEYLSSVYFILFAHAPEPIETEDDLTRLMEQMGGEFSAFAEGAETPLLSEMVGRADDVYAQLRTVETPDWYRDLHIHRLKLVKHIASLEEDFTASENDPVRRITTLGKIQSVFTLMTEYTKSSQGLLNRLGITDFKVEL